MIGSVIANISALHYSLTMVVMLIFREQMGDTICGVILWSGHHPRMGFEHGSDPHGVLTAGNES